MESAKLKHVLSGLFCNGLRYMEHYPKMAAAFGMPLDRWRMGDDPARVEGFIKALPPRALVNPDVFYMAMHVGLSNNFESSNEAIKHLFQRLAESKYPRGLFDETRPRFVLEASLIDNFIPEGNYFSSLSDDELKSAVTKQFSVSYRNLLSSPVDESFIFTKINHGYWEHFLSIYASSFAQRANAEEYRKLKSEELQVRYSNSGFDGILARVVQQTIEPQTVSTASGGGLNKRLSISFCAGEKQCAITLRSPLTQVSRGAMAGALTFFNVISKQASIPLGDGSEAKSLIDNRETDLFVDKYVRDADAVLFVVPPHLRNITIRGLDSAVYRMLIPISLAHETWRISLPIYHAVIREVMARHKKVVVLTQSAVLAPVLGLSMQGPENEGSLVRFFDLGRVLDVAAPEIVSKQAWFKPYAGVPCSELSPFELQDTATSAVISDNLYLD